MEEKCETATLSPDVNNNVSKLKNMTINQEVFTSKHDQILDQPYDYVMKYLPVNLSENVSKTLDNVSNASGNSHRAIQQLLTSLLEASILVEDVDQENLLQNGVPGAHHIYGLPMAINTAHYIKAKALQRLLKQVPYEKVSRVTKIFAEQLMEYHMAEGLQIDLKSKKNANKEEEEKEDSRLKKRKREAILNLGLRLIVLLKQD